MRLLSYRHHADALGLRAEDGAITQGFPLLEMMVVVAGILFLASIGVPSYRRAIVLANETCLRDDLYTMRSMIYRFTLDNQRPPESLDELVEKGYLGAIPTDPLGSVIVPLNVARSIWPFTLVNDAREIATVNRTDFK